MAPLPPAIQLFPPLLKKLELDAVDLGVQARTICGKISLLLLKTLQSSLRLSDWCLCQDDLLRLLSSFSCEALLLGCQPPVSGQTCSGLNLQYLDEGSTREVPAAHNGDAPFLHRSDYTSVGKLGGSHHEVGRVVHESGQFLATWPTGIGNGRGGGESGRGVGCLRPSVDGRSSATRRGARR